MRKLGLAPLVLSAALLAIPRVSAQQGQSATAAASLPDLKPDASGKLSQEQMQQLFRVVADKDMENDKRLRDYTYIERDVDHKLDGKGQVKSTESKTFEVMEIYGEQVQRLTEKTIRPSTPRKLRRKKRRFRRSLTSARTSLKKPAANANGKKKKIAKTAASSFTKLPTPTISIWRGASP